MEEYHIWFDYIKYGFTSFFFLKEKDVKMPKKIISSSKQYPKHLFTSWNTQQTSAYFICLCKILFVTVWLLSHPIQNFCYLPIFQNIVGCFLTLKDLELNLDIFFIRSNYLILNLKFVSAVWLLLIVMHMVLT